MLFVGPKTVRGRLTGYADNERDGQDRAVALLLTKRGSGSTDWAARGHADSSLCPCPVGWSDAAPPGAFHESPDPRVCAGRRAAAARRDPRPPATRGGGSQL